MQDNTYIIRTEELISGYGKKEILHGIDITISQREITTLIGRNGVGKTTLLNTIMGFIKPEKGRIYFRGEEITGIPSHLIVNKGISYVPQGKSIFPHMSVEEHIDIGAWTLPTQKEKNYMIEKIYNLFPRLNERNYQKAGTLSGGERQMLSIARALMSLPKLLLLDEPSFGLAPKLVDAVFETIKNINQDGVTIFLVEQNAKKALNNSDICYVMDMGKIILKDKSKDLLDNEQVKNSYLGGRRDKK